MEIAKAYLGTIVHCTSPSKLEVIEDGALLIDARGKILKACHARELPKSLEPAQIVDYSCYLIIPGLVDCHIHLPQMPMRGLGGGDLLSWLHHYTYPFERKFADPAYARLVSQDFFRCLAKVGTTTACVYSSIHMESTDLAFQCAAESGMRVIMGKTLMDQHCPDDLREAWELGLEQSLSLVRKWHNYDDGRLLYAMTPRFALSCSPESLRGAGDIAKEYDLHVQTHLAENVDECAKVRELYPDADSYTAVYDKAGLLREKTILAHCIHVNTDERRRLKDAGCGIAHCPSSNRFLRSGFFQARLMFDEGMRVGLGTDVAAGYHFSMIQEAREAIETSKIVDVTKGSSDRRMEIQLQEALYLATLGGAQALALDNVTGNFKPGKDADFVVVRDAITRAESNLHSLSVEERLLKLFYCHSEDSVIGTYVRGKKIY